LIDLNKNNQLPFKALKIGRWWDKGEEIDLVALSENGEYLFCECKWSVKHTGINFYEKLIKKTSLFPEAGKKYFCFFSRSGFSKELKQLAGNIKHLFLFNLNT